MARLPVALVFVASLACRPTPEPSLAKYLPASVAGYTAGALTVGEGFVRRDYSQGGVTIDVTIVQRPMSPGDYEGWSRQSAEYPQVALDAPTGSANGFFSCAGDTPTSACDLHIQFKSGYHLEVMGGGHATRAQLEDVLRRLPVRAIATSGPLP